MTVWGLEPATDAATRDAAVREYRGLLTFHAGLVLACGDLGLWEAVDEQLEALRLVKRALTAESEEFAGWSMVMEEETR